MIRIEYDKYSRDDPQFWKDYRSKVRLMENELSAILQLTTLERATSYGIDIPDELYENASELPYRVLSRIGLAKVHQQIEDKYWAKVNRWIGSAKDIGAVVIAILALITAVLAIRK